jgi:hypothetical protein
MTMQLTMKSPAKYEELLNKAVEKTLTKVFGATAKNTIYTYLETSHFIKKTEIARKLETFSQAMQEYLNTGAVVVEKEILESFYSGLGLYQRVELERPGNIEFVERLRTLMTS